MTPSGPALNGPTVRVVACLLNMVAPITLGAVNDMDQSRISHLAMPERLTGKSVVIVGLGSVGFPVMTHLVMAGVEHLVLVDPDVYDEPNLVKHPGRRTDIGRPKVEMAKDWVLDRHPTAQVVAHQNDALHPEFRDMFESALEHASVVVIVTDSKLSRVVLHVGAQKKCPGCDWNGVSLWFRRGRLSNTRHTLGATTVCLPWLNRLMSVVLFLAAFLPQRLNSNAATSNTVLTQTHRSAFPDSQRTYRLWQTSWHVLPWPFFSTRSTRPNI